MENREKKQENSTVKQQPQDGELSEKAKKTRAEIGRLLIEAEIERMKRKEKLDQYIEEIKANQPATLAGLKAVICVHRPYWDKQTPLTTQLGWCREYCKANQLEVVKELKTSTYDKTNLAELQPEEVKVLVVSMDWLENQDLSLIEEIKKVRMYLEVCGESDQ